MLSLLFGLIAGCLLTVIVYMYFRSLRVEQEKSFAEALLAAQPMQDTELLDALNPHLFAANAAKVAGEQQRN